MTKKPSLSPQSLTKRTSTLLMMAGSLVGNEMKRRVQAKLSSGDNAILNKLSQMKQAQRIVKDLGNLKGAAMKLGQVLALEARDYFPEEICQIFDQLQSQASSFDFTVIDNVLRNELGHSYKDLTWISQAPLAAASIGQVHRAKSGDLDLAIKIQYPGVKESIPSDLQALNGVLKALTVLMRKEYDLSGILNEFATIFIQETDYLKEAQYAQDFARHAQSVEQLIIPRVHSQYSTDKVLTMDFQTGLTLTEWINQDNPDKALREYYGKLILELYTYEFCEWGLVQTDPNLGNFLFRPQEKKLVLLDFGATKSYDAQFRHIYAKLVLAAIENNEKDIIRFGEELDLLDPRESVETKKIFQTMMTESMRPMSVLVYDFQDETYLQNMKILTRRLTLALKYSAPPKNLIFLHRKLSGIFFMLRMLKVKLGLKSYVDSFEKIAHSKPS
jgi:predicted unusual protein kinase regulating ubiquinone biosynthesis (AarF/ABC1/UbiB family)